MTFEQYKALALKIFPENWEFMTDEVPETKTVESVRDLLTTVTSEDRAQASDFERADLFSLEHATKGRLDGSFNFD